MPKNLTYVVPNFLNLVSSDTLVCNRNKNSSGLTKLVFMDAGLELSNFCGKKYLIRTVG